MVRAISWIRGNAGADYTGNGRAPGAAYIVIAGSDSGDGEESCGVDPDDRIVANILV